MARTIAAAFLTDSTWGDGDAKPVVKPTLNVDELQRLFRMRQGKEFTVTIGPDGKVRLR
ncbi:hypothetical protein ABT095_37710 [Kitasatospora sp. NPDC002227]|uniref:hypothetical protein n=1 Tax=Kitasatospora sp. NPDC002227 TaxID=3154773 RepID=UPI00332C9E24